jgi:hypothetical protein
MTIAMANPQTPAEIRQSAISLDDRGHQRAFHPGRMPSWAMPLNITLRLEPKVITLLRPLTHERKS